MPSRKVRALALLSALLLLASSVSALAGQDESPFDETGRYRETVTMTFSKVIEPGGLLPEGQTPEKNYITDWLLERYNIDAKLDWSADLPDYKNKLALNIASGSLPDLIYVDDYLMFHQMVENGMAADLTEIYPAYRTPALAGMDDSFDGMNIQAVTVDGRQYAIPGTNLGYGQDLLWLRKDWLDKLGLEPPRTLDELAAVIRAFIENDPDGNGQADTVGLPVHATKPVKGSGNQFGLEPIFAAFNCFPTQWMKDEEGKVYYGSTDPKMKEALALLRDWYEQGLIDKEFPARISTGETAALFESGRTGVCLANWASISEACYTNNPNAEYIALGAPVAADGTFYYMDSAPVTSMFVVNKDFAHPEAAVIALGAECDMNRGGADRTDPITSKYVDIWEGYINRAEIDNRGHRAIGIQGNLTFDRYDVVPLLGSRAKQLIETGSYDAYDGMSDFDKNQCALAKAYADGDRNAPNFWIYTARYIGSNATTEGTPVHAAYYYTTESSPSLKPTLDKLEDQMYLQIIIGEKPVEYFDEFVAQWKALGGDILTEEVQALVG